MVDLQGRKWHSPGGLRRICGWLPAYTAVVVTVALVVELLVAR